MMALNYNLNDEISHLSEACISFWHKGNTKILALIDFVPETHIQTVIYNIIFNVFFLYEVYNISSSHWGSPVSLPFPSQRSNSPWNVQIFVLWPLMVKLLKRVFKNQELMAILGNEKINSITINIRGQF